MSFPQFWNNQEFFTLSKGLAVLTSMITPALLLSATGTFILSTTTRLGRCVDRIRGISWMLESGFDPVTQVRLSPEQQKMLLRQVDYLGKRARILQDVVQSFYFAAAAFVVTSVAIGVASVFVARLSWMPITMGILGACFLCYGSMKMIFEARLSAASLNEEITFIEQGAERALKEPLAPVRT